METRMEEAPVGALQHIVATQCRETTFQPLQFFVSWNGVLCLVYKGFPPAIAGLKRFLFLVCDLPAENPGSLWPKTSLAALNDDIALTEDELALLLSVCEAASSKLKQVCRRVAVKRLHYIHYMCRFVVYPSSCGKYVNVTDSFHGAPFMEHAALEFSLC